jgi:hypothetical protein
MDNSKEFSSAKVTSGMCHCCGSHSGFSSNDITRRKFVQVVGTTAIGAAAMSPVTWASLASVSRGEIPATKRNPLVVKPILTYELPERRQQTSWRPWGGIQTEADALAEIKRIQDELSLIRSRADFPLEIMPVTGIRRASDLNSVADLDGADMFLVYAAGAGMDIFDQLNKKGKDFIFFCRHRSGPVYLWYEIISPRFLRQHTDKLAVKSINENDVVIDSQDEILWRLRALCGLKNTVDSRIVAIGGPGAWAQPGGVVPDLVRKKFRMDIRTVSYDELGELIKSAKADRSVTANAKDRAEKYLGDSGIRLETKKQYVENCFVLEDVLTRIMEKAGTRAITINECMGTIMPLSETTACLTLSLLNDAGYLAFCESDFVVVPAGILLANISGKPSFLNDPTYPHDGLITLAHCTAPRRMDGNRLEPARLLTHFESDYGAAPKVEMLLGQTVTNIMPDFKFERNVGLLGKIVDNPFLDICRSQIDVSFACDSRKVAEQMPGFHWITAYGDYLKESAYALNKLGIELEILS